MQANKEGVGECDHVVEPGARLLRELEAELAEVAAVDDGTNGRLEALLVVQLVAQHGHVVVDLEAQAWRHRVSEQVLDVELVLLLRRGVIHFDVIAALHRLLAELRAACPARTPVWAAAAGRVVLSEAYLTGPARQLARLQRGQLE